MGCVGLSELPPPPASRTGWPWTEQAPGLPDAPPGGGSWPKISIITPSRNQGRYIEETIRSVLLQGYPELEYIVIDGGSDDETVEVLRKYEPHLAYWVSEADRGQSHAINKGLARCTGEVFNWLNSDDLLLPGALAAVAAAWRRAPGRIVAGGLHIRSEDGAEDYELASAKLTLPNFVRWRQGRDEGYVFNQPATFVPTAAVREAGGVREDLSLVMDHFLMIELLQRCEVTYVPEVLARFRLHDVSKSKSMGGRAFDLQIIENLRTADTLPINVSPAELRAEHAEILFPCAVRRWQTRRPLLALGHLCGALRLSPGPTLRRWGRRILHGRERDT